MKFLGSCILVLALAPTVVTACSDSETRETRAAHVNANQESVRATTSAIQGGTEDHAEVAI